MQLDAAVPTLETLCGGGCIAGTRVPAPAERELTAKNEALESEISALRAEIADGWFPPEGHGLVDNVKRIESRITHFKGSRHVLQAVSGCLTGKLNSMSKALCHSTNGASCVA